MLISAKLLESTMEVLAALMGKRNTYTIQLGTTEREELVLSVANYKTRMNILRVLPQDEVAQTLQDVLPYGPLQRYNTQELYPIAVPKMEQSQHIGRIDIKQFPVTLASAVNAIQKDMGNHCTTLECQTSEDETTVRIKHPHKGTWILVHRKRE